MQKASILNQLAELEEIHNDHRYINEEEQATKASLAMKFEDIARNEEVAWRQGVKSPMVESRG